MKVPKLERRRPPKQPSVYSNITYVLLRAGGVFVLLTLAYIFYGTALQQVFGQLGVVVGFIVVWIVTSYFFIPRLHRVLTRLYLPNYYIGRAKTPDGLLADPINLAVYGDKQQLIDAMQAAGWVLADPLNLQTMARAVWAGALRRSYPSAPVSTLLLFDKPQQLAFQKEVGGNTHQRHHVRFWSTPKGWVLPGGHTADWLGAATFDRRVGLSLFTGQITHKIDEDTDNERDFVVADLQDVGADVAYVDNFNTAYHHRAAGGDSIKTDGAMPFIDLGMS